MLRRRWPWVTVAALCAVIVTVGALWISHQSSTSDSANSADCETVGALASKWNKLATASLSGNARADDWIALRNDARASAGSVSTPEIKGHLDEWAKGFDNLADLQNDLANPPSDSSRFELQMKVADAGTQTYGTAQELREECPNTWPSEHVEIPNDEWSR